MIFDRLKNQVLTIDNGLEGAANFIAFVPGLTELPSEKLFALLGTLPLGFAALGEASNFEITNFGTTELNLSTFAADLLFTSGTKLGNLLRTIGPACRTLLWSRPRSGPGTRILTLPRRPGRSRVGPGPWPNDRARARPSIMKKKRRNDHS